LGKQDNLYFAPKSVFLRLVNRLCGRLSAFAIRQNVRRYFMGVMLYLDICPDMATNEQWEKIYGETLMLVEAFPFAETVFDRDKFANFGLNFVYADRTREKDVDYKERKGLCWETDGDYKTFEFGETFKLWRDLDNYKGGYGWKEIDASQIKGVDILANRLFFERNYDSCYDSLESLCCVNCKGLFGAKTQGYYYHLPLLAIACLIVDRLPKAAYVYGDITRGQIKEAVRWANVILSEPIGFPDTMDNDKLLMRLKGFIPDENVLLSAFCDLTMNPSDDELGHFIRNNFSREAINDYNRKDLASQKPGTLGASDYFLKYFDMGFTLKDLCGICLFDGSEDSFTSETFIKQLLETQLYVMPDEKKIFNPTGQTADSAQPESVLSLFGNLFMKMGGIGNVATKAYLPLEQIKSVLRDEFKGIDTDSIVDAEMAGMAETTELKATVQKSFENRVKAFEAEQESYDIAAVEQLMDYKEGNSISPIIETRIAMVKKFVDEHCGERLKKFVNVKSRMAQLVSMSRSFLLPKCRWDYVVEHISDDRFYSVCLALFGIEVSDMRTHDLLKPIIVNKALFDKCFM
jgi:hypothetical protein